MTAGLGTNKVNEIDREKRHFAIMKKQNKRRAEKKIKERGSKRERQSRSKNGMEEKKENEQNLLVILREKNVLRDRDRCREAQCENKNGAINQLVLAKHN